MEATTFEPTDADFDLLEKAPVNEALATDRNLIIRALKLHSGNIPDAPKMKVITDEGVTIRDSFEMYLTNKEFYSTGSFAKLALGTPLDFQWDISEGVKKELEQYKERSHFDLGTFLHLAILEPEQWDMVVVEPEASRASHDGCDTLIEFWEMQTARVPGYNIGADIKLDQKKNYIDKLKVESGKACITAKDALIIKVLKERWMDYMGGAWYYILEKAIKEVSMYANEYNGLPMRIRPDGLLFENQIGVNAIVSVKTTSAKTIRQFVNQCVQLGYNIKEAAYQDIASHVSEYTFNNTISVIFQTVEPFNVGVFIWNKDDIAIGRGMFNDAHQEAIQCIKSNSFPGWEELADDGGMIELDMPGWVGGSGE